MTKQLNY